MGFNPRPPLLAGDAHKTHAGERVGLVSIRARHYWRAMLLRSIASSHEAQFQSAPAITGGRCRTEMAIAQLSIVSIRARHYWRAMQKKNFSPAS